RFTVTDWWAAIFNPSMPYRVAHMTMASFLTGAFVVAGVAGWHLLTGRSLHTARPAFSLAICMATFAAPVQVLLGDQHGLNPLEHQPIKVAAMEGNWQTMRGAPLLLFAIPDQSAARNDLEIGIPKGASLILRHELDGEVPGLTEVPPSDRPSVVT